MAGADSQPPQTHQGPGSFKPTGVLENVLLYHVKAYNFKKNVNVGVFVGIISIGVENLPVYYCQCPKHAEFMEFYCIRFKVNIAWI